MTHPVAIAYVHPGSYSAAFGYCTMRTMVYEIGRTGQVPAVIAQRCASGQLVEARNETVQFFLDGTPCEWVLLVDSDMGFDAPLVEALLASADPVERPVVGALCFGLKKDSDDDALQAVRLVSFPTVYVWREKVDEVGFQIVTDYPRDALVQCDASGAACVLVHRSVLETIRSKYGDHWFDKMTHPTPDPEGTTFSEDMSFFVRVQACDFPVFVDTSVKTSHDKGGIFLTEESWDDQQAVRALRAAADTSTECEAGSDTDWRDALTG